MQPLEIFDILVFGGGKAGKTLAMDQARQGKRVAMIEADKIGGSCINIACIPSKALIRSAGIAEMVRHAPDFGSDVDGPRIDQARVAGRTAAVVAGMVRSNADAFETSGLELVLGWGRFVDARVIEVTTAQGARRLSAERIYLNLGTRAEIPDLPGLRAAEPMTHVEILKLDVLPERLLVLGGGFIGIEMAQAFRRLGSEVVLIERGAQIAGREDEDIAAAIRNVLEDAGVELVFRAGEPVVSGRSGETVVVELGDGRSISGTHLLVATGRQPMTADIGLELAGVERDERGFIRTSQHLETSAPGIWALGECAGTPMFTHASLDDYRIARSAIDGPPRSRTGRIIPYCVFIDPEFARIGLNEAEAKARGIAYRIARLPMAAVPRARTLSAQAGFMKALVAAESDRILGFAMLGEQAGEVMAVVQVAMLGNMPFTVLRDAILAHPTLAEGLNLLFGQLPAKSPDQ